MELVLENLETYAPVTLSAPSMSDDEFLEFCREHEDLRVESNSEGEIVIMPPVGPVTSHQNSGVTARLYLWSEQDGRGWAFDSSAMFVLPNGARRSPDAAWIETHRIEAVPEPERGRLWRICPTFVIEIRSQSDRRVQLERKMREWMDNGARLGWLIDPIQRNVMIFRADGSTETVAEQDQVCGEGPVSGFVLDLGVAWRNAPARGGAPSL